MFLLTKWQGKIEKNNMEFKAGYVVIFHTAEITENEIQTGQLASWVQTSLEIMSLMQELAFLMLQIAIDDSDDSSRP